MIEDICTLFSAFDKRPQVAQTLNKLGCRVVDFEFEAGGLV
jgi:hypothetical protein